MKPSDYLGFYAERFHTVKVDSTFYACPTVRTVENWNARTPDGFVFSVKVPQTITHDKGLVDCDAEIAEFLEVMISTVDVSEGRHSGQAAPPTIHVRIASAVSARDKGGRDLPSPGSHPQPTKSS